MSPLRIRFRTYALGLSLWAGHVAVAIAQPAAVKQPQAAPAGVKQPVTAPGAVKQPEAAPAAAQPTPEASPSGPSLESPLLSEPKTPAELFDAVVLTDRLDRPALAKRYLEKLLQSNPPEQVLLDLRNTYGPAIFVHLARNPNLQPAASQLLASVTAAYRKQIEDPVYLDGLIRGLAGAPADREAASQLLKNIGPAVVPRILRHVAAPGAGESAEVLVQTLVELGDQIVPALLGGLESTNDAVRVAAMQALGLLRSKPAVPYLFSGAFDEAQPAGVRAAARSALASILGVATDRGENVSPYGAEGELKNIARNHLANRVQWPTSGGTTDLWTWNEDSKELVLNRLSPVSASLYTGLRFARQALSLAREDREAQVLFLALFFAWDAQAPKERPAGTPVSGRRGHETPRDVALTAGPDVVSDTLALAVGLQNSSVALGALGAMADVGARGELYGSRPLPSPLFAALNFPNSDVQYAAAVTILRVNPATRFRGSERVVEVLAQTISGTATPFAVVIDANHERGNEVAGLFGRAGFETVAAFAGREGFEVATARGNVVLVVVHANCIRWPLSQTIANLRADARSARIPIVIYGPESVRGEVQGALAHYSPIVYLVESTTPQYVEAQIGGFLKHALALAQTPADHSARVADAVSWLAYIATANRTNIFNLQLAENALMALSADRNLFADSLTALAALPTATVQKHFEQFAVSERLDPPIREAAARHLAAHIQRHGLLIAAAEAAELDAAWRSAKDPEMATALAAVIGSLKPNARRVGDRLQSVAPPSKPLP